MPPLDCAPPPLDPWDDSWPRRNNGEANGFGQSLAEDKGVIPALPDLRVRIAPAAAERSVPQAQDAIPLQTRPILEERQVQLRSRSAPVPAEHLQQVGLSDSKDSLARDHNASVLAAELEANLPHIDLESGGHGKVAKKPFSRFRCLWEPDIAADEEFCEPFAKLEVTILRAHNLVDADSSGLSDPFCTMELNGKVTGMETKVVPQSLAPVWNDSFTLDIYHPESILTIAVVDKDFGTNLAALDFLGLDDDFLGWVDLRLNVLPFNVKVSGWYDLGRAENYVDSLAGRRRVFGLDAPSDAGRIEVSLLLKATPGLDVLFAHALPTPSLGEDLPPIDLLKAKDTYGEVMDGVKQIMPEIQAAYARVSSYPTLKTVMLVLFIWYPRDLLPFVLLLISLVFLITWLFWPCWYRRKFKLLNSSLSGGVKQPLLEDATVNGEAKSKDKNNDQVTKLLQTIQPFLDPEGAKNVRRVQKILASVLQLSQATQELVRQAKHRDWRLLVLALAILALAAATAYFRAWLGELMAVVLTLVVAMVGLQATLLAKFMLAIGNYVKTKQVRAVLTTAAKKSGKIHLTKLAARRVSALGLPVWTGYLKPGDLIRSPESPRLQAEDTAHELQEVNFLEPTWCSACGRFLWGVSKQGWQCNLCMEGFCQECARDLGKTDGPLECQVKLQSNAVRTQSDKMLQSNAVRTQSAAFKAVSFA